MRLGLVFSILLHAIILAFAVITIERATPWLENQPDIPVEVVTVAEKANVKAATPEAKPEQQPPAPAPAPAPQPTQLAQAEPPMPKPDLAEPEPAPQAKPMEQPKEQPKPEPVPQSRPAPKKGDKQNNFDLDAIAVLLNKEQKTQQREEKTAQASPGNQADKPRQQVGEGTDMTITLVQSLQRQVERCWDFPAGAVQPETLVVGVTIYLKPDGTLSEPPRIDDQSRMDEPYYRAAAESALRAISQCQPYDLPPDQYDVWKEIDWTFDPSKMIGITPPN